MNERSTELELLDGDSIPAPDLFQNLRELEKINRLLGGHQLNRKAFIRCLPKVLPETLLVIELASGGGDNLRDLAAFCRQKGINAQFIGVDLKADCVDFAQESSQSFPEISYVCSDYRDYTPAQPVDIAFSSLFCHHLSNEDILTYLRWNARYAQAFFINDLHRHWLAEKAIKGLTQLFSRSYLVKNDAPASVRRGFKKSEWEYLIEQADLSVKLSWQWAFRWMIVAKNGT